MEEVDNAATVYLQELLSPENQKKIAAALRKHQTEESGRVVEFNAAIKRKIAEKQGQYDSYMDKLGAVPCLAP